MNLSVAAAQLKANADDCEYTLWGRSNNKHVRKGYASEELFIRFPKATSPSRAAAAAGHGADGGGSGNVLTSSLSGRLSGVSSKPGLLGSRKSGGGAMTPCAGAAAAPVLAVLPAPECSKTTRPEQLGNVLELAESGDLPAFLDSKVRVCGGAGGWCVGGVAVEDLGRRLRQGYVQNISGMGWPKQVIIPVPRNQVGLGQHSCGSTQHLKAWRSTLLFVTLLVLHCTPKDVVLSSARLTPLLLTAYTCRWCC